MVQKLGLVGVAALLIVALTCVPRAAQESQKSTAEAPPAQNTQTVKVDVDLVLVNATVTTDKNQYLTGLQRENFQVWEDKTEQQISYFSTEDVPMSVGIIFDMSGSMKDKLQTARSAYSTFLRGGNKSDEYFLVEFSDRPRVAANFTTDITKLQNKLMFEQAKGQTALYDAVYLGLDTLKEANNPKKALLLITDGEDNKSRYHFSDVKEFVKEKDVQIYSIGIVDDWNSQLGAGRTGRALLEELSDLTGGRAFFPPSVNDLEDTCEKIAVELKNQYVIGYHPTNKAKDGKWRKLKVKVTPPKGTNTSLNVRSKEGYYGPSGATKTAGSKDKS
jgi:Ca-activated chloride channel homolog